MLWRAKLPLSLAFDTDHHLAIGPQGNVAYAAHFEPDRQAQVRVFAQADGKQLQAIRVGGVQAMDFGSSLFFTSPHSLALSHRKSTEAIDLETGEKRVAADRAEGERNVDAVGFAAGKRATVSYERLRVYDVSSWKLLRDEKLADAEIEKHFRRGQVAAVAVSPDGEQIAVRHAFRHAQETAASRSDLLRRQIPERLRNRLRFRRSDVLLGRASAVRQHATLPAG